LNATANRNRPPAGDYGAGLPPGAREPGLYAASAIASRGRLHAESECTTRSPFQRDRDRILHATAFRRLTHKTQVFVFHEGDHYRTRLTHSLEVAQIARTVARQLRLDEDLAEAIALAHDLGHPPFGHAGERALDQVMQAFGGFDHNAQSLRVVTVLERKYAGFDGLNLTWETLEGLAKHNGPEAEGSTSAVAKIARSLEAWHSLELSTYPSAEAQVAALSDDIAYVSHDIDDGLRAGLIALSDLEAQPLVGPAVAEARPRRG
jgi:dGTPase